MFAVIETGGKQYRVAQNDIVTVERLDGDPGESVTFDRVLMMGSGEDVEIGAPVLDGAQVTAEVVDQTRARKILIFKKKRRKHYRRHAGHRQEHTVLKITEILAKGAKPKAAAKKAAPAKAATTTTLRRPQPRRQPAKKAAPKKAAAKKGCQQKRRPPRRPRRPRPIVPIARRTDPWRIKKQAAARATGATHRVNGWA